MSKFKTFIISTLFIVAMAAITIITLGNHPLIYIAAAALIGFAGYTALESDEHSNFTLRSFLTKGLLIVIWLPMITGIIKLHNQVVVYERQYVENINNQESFRTNLYVVYTEKQKITNLNKETFIEITDIIMSGRKDGQSLAWKWLQENQPIPYGEFTEFYKDLSSFIANYKTELYNFDTVTNAIVKEHNTLLSIFPNNIYNRVLNKSYLDEHKVQSK